jgi:hypothetical protein
MARLFLSYRRSDTGAYADRLAARLARFQFDAIFQDREDIALADNYADRIRADLSQCDAVLVLIGRSWTEARDAAGQRRLDDPADWVRREIALALSMRLKVIPVLFDAARVPAAGELPAGLAPLATAQGYDINGNYFDRDADDLASRLEQVLVASARIVATPQSPVPNRVLGQLQAIWVTLCAITIAVSIAPFFVPILPQFFWLFPGTMTVAAFFWWLYWLGESLRPARPRTT